MNYYEAINFANTATSIGLFLGVTLSIFLLFNQSAKNKANLFLGLLILCYSANMLQGYLYGSRVLDQVPHLIWLGNYLVPFVGPLMYFYVLACTEKGFKMHPKLYLHFIPFIISMIGFMPIAMLDGASKYALFVKLVNEGELAFPAWHRMLRVLHMAAYFILSVLLILRYRRHISNTSSNIHVAYHRWLLFFSLTLIAPVCTYLLFGLTNNNPSFPSILMGNISFFLTCIYLAVLFKPSLFNKFPNQIDPVTENSKKKYQNSSLHTEQKEKLVEKLLTYMEKEQPFQQSELTLDELAEQVNIPSHYLSQIINEKLQVNFLDFVNKYRVEKAKELMTNPKYEHYTIIAAAFEAGFNSKTAFYTAFKRFTGTTPGKYRRSVAA
ncbi:MAG: helix-turn-helix domain-containing protein [Saprospiraceae bacterium]